MIAAVHTTGINWESLGTLISILTAVIGGVGRWVIHRQERSREFVRQQIATVADALAGRLDKVDAHLGEQDVRLNVVGERVSRLEGPQHAN